MTINIKIKSELDIEKYLAEIEKLHIKKSLGGDIMIFDHKDMDIVIDEENKKITTFAKGDFSDLIYSSQNRFFKYMFSRGITTPGTVRGANVFGAIEARYEDKEQRKHLLELIIYNIANFITEESKYFETFESTDAMEDERLLDPNDKDSTELGEVPQEPKKGTINPGTPGYYYGLAGVYRY